MQLLSYDTNLNGMAILAELLSQLEGYFIEIWYNIIAHASMIFKFLLTIFTTVWFCAFVTPRL